MIELHAARTVWPRQLPCAAPAALCGAGPLGAATTGRRCKTQPGAPCASLDRASAQGLCAPAARPTCRRFHACDRSSDAGTLIAMTSTQYISSAIFRVRNTDQVRRSWRRASLRFAARVLRQWREHDAAMLLDTIAENIMYDIPPARTPTEEWG